MLTDGTGKTKGSLPRDQRAGAKAVMSRTLAGTCVCGAVRYEVADSFRYACNCHCSQCRRATGSAFKPLAGVERKHFSLVAGAHNLLTLGTELNHDARCAACGSLLYSMVREGEWVHVAMGSLLDDPTIRPTEHIFVASKAPWFTITDDLPQFAEHAVGAPLNRP